MSTPYRTGEPPVNDLPCPRCEGTLAPIREMKLVGRRCSWCMGIWLDRKVLDEVLDHGQTRALLAKPQPVAEDDGDQLRCPHCDLWMIPYTVSSTPSIKIDQCDHGIWLDRNELEAIVHAFPRATDVSMEPKTTPSNPSERSGLEALLQILADL